MARTKSITDKTPVVFDKKRFWLEDFYDTFEQAEIACARANKKSDDHPYITASYGLMLKMQRKHFLQPAKEITESHWWEMLEVLPPLSWRQGIVETFIMSEFWIGSYTNQYGRYGDKYIVKMIDVNDRSTFITLKDFI